MEPRRRASRWLMATRYWLPVLAWMLFIFGLSTGAGAPRHTSRIIGPIVRWLIPSISEESLGVVIVSVRKTAHVAEYAVLALLLWRARRGMRLNPENGWRWSDAAFALAVAVLFAVSDEWHQSFVPSREGHVRDVCIDAAGAFLGLIALHRIGRWKRQW